MSRIPLTGKQGTGKVRYNGKGETKKKINETGREILQFISKTFWFPWLSSEPISGIYKELVK